MEIYDTIRAHQIEYGDQVVVNGDHLMDAQYRDTDDPQVGIIRGYSVSEGDMVEYPVAFDQTVDLWAV